MKAKKWGRIINTASAHSLVASPIQVGLCHRQARPRRPHQDGRAGDRDRSASPPTASRPAMSGRRWSRSQIPDTMKARGMTREQVMNDVLLAGQPTKQFVTARAGRRASRCSCAATKPRRSPAPTSRWTAAGPRPDRRGTAPGGHRQQRSDTRTFPRRCASHFGNCSGLKTLPASTACNSAVEREGTSSVISAR